MPESAPRLVNCVTVFVDIRGFTKWSTSTDVFLGLGEFVQTFFALLASAFDGDFIKPLGDGAMIVREVPKVPGDGAPTIASVLAGAASVDLGFVAACEAFAESCGHPTQLRLGWGVTRGMALKLTEPFADYYSQNVNKSARMCDKARPHGVLVDADDFPDLGLVPSYAFESEPVDLDLKGLGPARAWATSCSVASPAEP